MNLMSNARLFQDDGKTKNDLMFDMLPQVKFNMMGQIQIQQDKVKKSRSSLYSSPSPPSSSSSPSPLASGSGPTVKVLDKSKINEDSNTIDYESHSGQHPDRSNLLSPPCPGRNSPIDFSNKKIKVETFSKFLNQTTTNSNQSGSQGLAIDEPDSPCSRLRNILKMKTPASPEFSSDPDRGTVLNLSRDNLPGQEWGQGRHTTSSSSSSPSGPPSGIDPHYVTSLRQLSGFPGPSTSSYPVSVSNNVAQSLGLSTYAILNPTMTQPTSFETSNSLTFSQSGSSASARSPTFGVVPHPPPPHQGSIPGNLISSVGMGKSRVTRPFKAYPKDPLTFPTVGLYGLPVGPAPGVTEAFIHQQSNHAYAEFRKQMLNQTNNSSRSKRIGQVKPPHQALSDSITSSTSSMEFGLGSGSGVSEVMGNVSGGEECLSTSDDGYSTVPQSHSKNRVKSDEQLKDDAYWERRRKNNEAAKRSRDARRAKEDEIAIRAAFLEQENLKLRFEVCALKNETAKLRCLLYKGQ